MKYGSWSEFDYKCLIPQIICSVLKLKGSVVYKDYKVG